MIRLVQVTLAAALTMALILMLGIMALRPAQAADTAWWSDCRHGWISKEFDAPDVSIDAPVHTTDEHDGKISARITYDELRNLKKDLSRITRALKACDAYRKCEDDRAAGKVKHCYENDRRWREYFANDW